MSARPKTQKAPTSDVPPSNVGGPSANVGSPPSNVGGPSADVRGPPIQRWRSERRRPRSPHPTLAVRAPTLAPPHPTLDVPPSNVRAQLVLELHRRLRQVDAQLHDLAFRLAAIFAWQR